MGINILAVIIAAASAFVLGFLWYTVLFAKTWQKLIGLKGNAKDNAPNLGKFLVGSFILELLMAWNLAMFIGPHAGWSFGLFAGVATGLGWVSFAFGVNYMFEGKSFKLWLINAGYNTLVFAVMGLIIGAM